MRTSTRYLALLVACITGIVTALVVPSRVPHTTEVHPSTRPPCAIRRCNSGKVYTLPKSFLENLQSANDTSVAVRESSLAIRNSSLAIRDIPIAVRDPLPFADDAQSTTTTTFTASLVTSTMSFKPSLTLVDGTTDHFSTTTPWGPVDSTSTTGNAATILSNGAPATTISTHESTLSIKPPPSVTSTRSFVTISNVSTTTTTQASNVSTSAILSNSVVPYCNGTCTSSYIPVVTSYQLTTVDASTDTNSLATATSTASSEAPTGSNTGFVQNSAEVTKCGYYKIGVALAMGVVINIVLLAFM